MDAAPGRRVHHEAARHDEDFLVRERDGLAALDCREHGLERFGPGRRTEHEIDVGVRGHGGEPVAPGARQRGRRRQPGREAIERPAGGHRDDRRPVSGHLPREHLHVAARGEPDDLEAPRMRVDDRQGALPDRAGRSENGDAFRHVTDRGPIGPLRGAGRAADNVLRVIKRT
jgi:hypothetical protein